MYKEISGKNRECCKWSLLWFTLSPPQMGKYQSHLIRLRRLGILSKRFNIEPGRPSIMSHAHTLYTHIRKASKGRGPEVVRPLLQWHLPVSFLCFYISWKVTLLLILTVSECLLLKCHWSANSITEKKCTRGIPFLCRVHGPVKNTDLKGKLKNT